jgi:hypothetical protein
VCDPLTDPSCIVKSVVSGVSNSIFDQLTKWWSDAFSSMTSAFSKAFLAAGDISINKLQSSGLWRLEVGVGATIAAGLMIWAGARSAWTRSGDPIAAGVVGAIKAVFATAMVFVIVTALLGIADGLTQAVINASAGDGSAFATKVGQLASISGLGATSGALVFLFAVLGVLITAVLWAEMLIRAAGIVIVTVSTPVGAAGLVSPRTAGWWRRLVSAEIALIFVKPVVALVLAVGFTVSHDSSGIQGALVGFMVLAAAALAWPVVGRMFTFFEGQFAIGGMAAAFGLAEGVAGRFSGGRSNGTQPYWQSMEQASSRTSGANGTPGLGTGDGVAEVGATTSRVASGLGSAASRVGGTPAGANAARPQADGGAMTGAAPAAAGAAGAAVGAGGVVTLAGMSKQAAAKAVEAPGRMLSRAGDMAGIDNGAPATPEDTWTREALQPAERPSVGEQEGA